MGDENLADSRLNPGAESLVQAAVGLKRQEHGQLGVYHWLAALLERHAAMAESMVSGLDAARLQGYVSGQLAQGQTGAALDRAAVLEKAEAYARQRGRPTIGERDLAYAILTAAGYQVAQAAPAAPPPVQSGSVEPSAAQPGEALQTEGYRPRAIHPIPALEQIGVDLTRAAQEGRLSPLVGRTDELELVVETLCRRTKRNPVLVGPAGVGKTAIVEGLAQRVVSGLVPPVLQGIRIIGLQPSSLVAGADVRGELEKRMKAILAEAAQDGIVLFIDEVHAIIGAGGMPGTNDVASLLKPALARGELSCIAATTDDEYRRYVEQDSALERRFQPIRVQELSPEQTLQVLKAFRDGLATQRSIQVSDETLGWLVDFAGRYLRNRYFPDKAIDLLEQCAAHAQAAGKQQVDRIDAEAVAQRMVGVPLKLDEGLRRLAFQLVDQGLVPAEAAEALAGRLRVTMRGLDLRQARPNAVVLLVDEAARNAEAVAALVAEELFGGSDRVVRIDFSRFVHPADVTMLVGSAPGYVGYSESLPMHRVVQMPWCVVWWESIHACHPVVREVVVQALASGFLTDGRGRRIYLSDTVVLMTAGVGGARTRGLGFGKTEEVLELDLRDALGRELGDELLRQVDLICSDTGAAPAQRRRWVEGHLLADFATRWRKEGVHLTWDASVTDWILAQQTSQTSLSSWERLVDEQLSPLLIPYLSKTQEKEVLQLVLKYAEGKIMVEVAGAI